MYHYTIQNGKKYIEDGQGLPRHFLFLFEGTDHKNWTKHSLKRVIIMHTILWPGKSLLVKDHSYYFAPNKKKRNGRCEVLRWLPHFLISLCYRGWI